MLYIDVTQLIHWSGNLTGIPRVMNELSTRFDNNDSKEKKFITWDPTAKEYKLIDITKTLEKRGKEIHFQTSSGKPFSSANEKGLLFKVVRKVNDKLIPVPKKILSLLDGKSKEAGTPNFRSKDTLFVLWGEQSSEDFIKHLIGLHKKDIKLVQISYDLLPLITPQYSGHSTDSMKKYTESIFPLCSLVLSISESTKRDMEKWMKERGLIVPKVQVFRLGDDFELSNPKKPTSFQDLSDGFILTVGTIEARKNHTLLYYVYKNAVEKGVEIPSLIIVGRLGWRADDIYSLITNDPEVNKKITILKDISDEELAWLYTNCKFSVYPSFYEGWGLPIAESISYGSPCIASNTSSMPEIAGDLIDYFSPTSTEECLDLIVKYNTEEYLKIATTKIEKYKTTTWDQTFNEVDSYIMEVA